jgi:hypothetical protein
MGTRCGNAAGFFVAFIHGDFEVLDHVTSDVGFRTQHKITTEERKSRWTGERIARLGFLLGIGWDAKRIAGDPIIASTANNVHRQAQRFGLAFRAAANVGLRLPPGAASVYDAAAAKRSLTREAMIRLLVLTVAEEPTLLDNILDDGE